MSPKKFSIGNKVFAKVKGYPAWPAFITGVNKSTYDVKFYGTGEVGAVKPKDLYYYLRNREKFTKGQKRRLFLEGIRQMDMIIAESGGTDGSRERDSFVSETPSESGSFINGDTSTSKRNLIKTPTGNKRRKSNIEQDMFDMFTSGSAESPESSEEINASILSETIVPMDSKECEPSLSIKDIIIITPEYLRNVMSFFEQVKKCDAIYRNIPPETKSCKLIELMIVKTVTNEFVGVKYNRDMEKMTFDSEYEQAEYDYNDAKTLLDIKWKIDNGELNFEDRNLFVTNLNITEAQIEESLEMAVITRKKKKLNFLKIENKLAELDTRVKKSLCLDQANPETAITALEEILRLELKLLMLIKHPGIFDMARRLRCYIGNVDQWNYTSEEYENFKLHAERVRNVAEEVYRKFIKVLEYDEDADPWEWYLEKVGQFSEVIRDQSESVVYGLTALPYTRDAFFDTLEGRDELTALINKLGSSKLRAVAHIGFQRHRLNNF